MSQLDHLRALHWSGTPVSDVWFGLMQLAAETEQMTTLVSPETERALRGVLARTLGIAGTVAVVDLDNHNASERALLRGLSAARKSDDSRLIAWLYGKLAHRRIYDFSGNRIANLLEALKYVQYADRYAGDNPVVLADLLNTKGEALAALGRESAIGDIHVAGTMMESAPEDITPEWLSHFNESRVHSMLGACYLRLNNPKDARYELDISLMGIGENHSHEVIVLADSARAYAQIGEPEQARQFLTYALPVAQRSRSALRTTRIRAARHELHPLAHEPFIIELDERLHAASLS